MGIQEGLWDCPGCEGTNRGRHLRCQGCGATREEDAKFYLPEGEPDILPDNPVYAVAAGGADWICPYCDTSNRAGNPTCDNCGGGSKEEGSEREVFEVPPEPKPKEASASPTPAPKDPKEKSSCSGCLIKLAIFHLILFAVVAFFGQTHEAKVEVVGHHWIRTLQPEEYRTLHEGSWSNEVPSDARNRRQERKIRSYRQVLVRTETKTRRKTRQVQSGTEQYKCGKINMGNGFFKDKYCSRPKYRTESYTETYQEPIYRDEPVYDTYVNYDVDRWVGLEKLSREGSDQVPLWPDYATNSTHRVGPRTEVLTLLLKGEGKDFRREVSRERFQALAVGTHLKAEINRLGTLKKVYWPDGVEDEKP